jgi:very-short-patch-repair endonuclease
VPFVEDRKNCLVLQPASPQAPEVMASLQAALKSAIQVEFQLEDSELAAEALPSEADRRVILLFESAEGGAGVLRRMVKEPDALARVARAALELCHYDPDSGDDRAHAPGAKEACEAACYDCLLSYGNQREQRLLDRKRIGDLHVTLRDAEVEPATLADTPADHLARLLAQAGSELERRWLRSLHDHGHVLPTSAQRLIAGVYARPDFAYGAEVVIFIDGPVHQYPNIAERDVTIRSALEEGGYLVIAFSQDESTWPDIIARYPAVFGQPGISPT